MNCPSCGETVAPGSIFCANCGVRLPAPPVSAPAAVPQPASSADDTVVGARPHSLLALAGPEQGQTFPLVADTTRLGRDLDNEIMLTDPRISRHHAEIELKGQDYLIFDMGSPNGVFVNAMRVTGPQVLRDGDNIRLGDTVLVFSPQPVGAGAVENVTWDPDVTPVPAPLPPEPTATPPPPPRPSVTRPITPPPPPPPPAPAVKPVAPPPPPPPPAAAARPVAPERSLDTIVEKKRASNTRWFFMTCLLIIVLLILFAVLVWLAIPRVSVLFPTPTLPGS